MIMKDEINPKYSGALHLRDPIGASCYKYVGALHQKANYLMVPCRVICVQSISISNLQIWQ
jgi:hypothetical protein